MDATASSTAGSHLHARRPRNEVAPAPPPAANRATALCRQKRRPRQATQIRRFLTAAIALTATVPIVAAFTIEQPSFPTRRGDEIRGLSRPRPSMLGIRPSLSRRPTLAAGAAVNGDDDAGDGDGMEMPPSLEGFAFEDEAELAEEDLRAMTVAQLQQQLRLRGKKVTGIKAHLVARLLDTKTSDVSGAAVQPGYSKYDRPRAVQDTDEQPAASREQETAAAESQRVAEAKARGADVVDVADFVEVADAGKAFRSSDRDRRPVVDAELVDADVQGEEGAAETDGAAAASSSPEVWGEDARVVDDYEGRSVVVDGLSRTVVEFKGAGDAIVQAYVAGSRDALKNFLRGGDAVQKRVGDDKAGEKAGEKANKKAPAYASLEEEVYAIQTRREREARRGMLRFEEAEGEDDPEDPGVAYTKAERDFGDWGVYTPTGAQLSSSEVQGVLLLSDVYGPFTDATQALADKIALECQPVVVLAPDLFRGKPWTTSAVLDAEGVERNEEGQSYEEWRARHPGRRVDVDIRAAAAALRQRYAVSSIAVWGTCYGGGRALEAAAGWYEGGAEAYYEDSYGSRRPAPPHVDPIAAIAWYPTRYNATTLFGDKNEGFRTFESGEDRSVAVMAVFAEEDALPGATPEDARVLKQCLDEDSRIKDSLVKIFPDQQHGFAHRHLGEHLGAGGVTDGEGDPFSGEEYGSAEELAVGGDAEVACLLSTAWMETYTRVFLPTVGSPVRSEPDERWSTLEMDGAAPKSRKDIRDELEEALARQEDAEVDLARLAQARSPLMDGPGSAAFDRIEEERERKRKEVREKYDISAEDDEETFMRKFRRAEEDGALEGLFVEADRDEAGGAYW